MGDMNRMTDQNPIPYFVRVLTGKAIACARSEGLSNYPLAYNGYPEAIVADLTGIDVNELTDYDEVVLTFLPHELDDASLPRYNEYEDPSTAKVIFRSLRNNNNSSEKQGPLSKQEEAVIKNPSSSVSGPLAKQEESVSSASASVSGTKVETGEDPPSPEEEPLLKRPRLTLKPDSSATSEST